MITMRKSVSVPTGGGGLGSPLLLGHEASTQYHQTTLDITAVRMGHSK